MIDLDSIAFSEDRGGIDLLKEVVDVSVPETKESFHEVLSQNAAEEGEGISEHPPAAQSTATEEGSSGEESLPEEETAEALLEESPEDVEEEHLRREEEARSRPPTRGAGQRQAVEGTSVKDLNAHHPLVSSLMVHGAKGGDTTLAARNTNQNLLDQWKSVNNSGVKTPEGATRAEAKKGAERPSIRVLGNKDASGPVSLEGRQGLSRNAMGVEQVAEGAGKGDNPLSLDRSARGRVSDGTPHRGFGNDAQAPRETPKETNATQAKNTTPLPLEGQSGNVETSPTAGRAPNGGIDIGSLSPRSMTSTVAMSPGSGKVVDSPAAPQLADRVRLEEFSAGLERFVLKGTSKVQMRLDPPDLGTVDIDIEVTKGEVFLSVRAESVEAVNALQSELELLRESLKEQGLDLSHFELGHPDRDAANSGRDSASTGTGAKDDKARRESETEAEATTTRGITADGRLDVMV